MPRPRAKGTLQEYRRKRDFTKTQEPSKTSSRLRKGSRFVVQLHAASHLHFDFRLELDGVLKSWAVPKGPSADPAIKRLAVQVEDHPLDYFDFEGVIPEGEYGGGTVMVWDAGRWTPEGNAHDGLRRGKMKFTLHGRRLRGGWMLMRFPANDSRGKPQWLLRKEQDRFARHAEADDSSAGLVSRSPTSVITRRTLQKIAKAGDRVWGDDGEMTTDRSEATRPARSRTRSSARSAVRLTSPDRMVYPDMDFTKKDLFDYYQSVARRMLTHSRGRAVSLVRCPDGAGKACFFQKHPHRAGANDRFISAVRIKDKSGLGDYLVVTDVESILAAVQMGAMEFHPWGSRVESLEFADYLVFDLDPGEDVTWRRVINAAKTVRAELRAVGLNSFVRTSGGKGLHVVTPLMSGVGWDDAKTLARTIAQLLATKQPKTFVSSMSKSKRRGLIFIDYLRNGRGATAIANYSTRARPGGPIATPVSWNELSRLKSAAQFTVGNIRARLARLKSDPWRGFRLPAQPAST